MRHTNTPDEDGWYWIEDCDGDWTMAHLCGEWRNSDVTVLTIFELTNTCVIAMDRYVEVESGWHGILMIDGKLEKRGLGEWVGPRQWYGPLQCPGGDFGGNIVEFADEAHREAARDKKALVMLAIDFAHCDEHHGRIESYGRMTMDEAYAAQKRTFLREESQT